MTADPETIVLAFSPTDADHAVNGHHWSLYSPDLDDPYDVPMGTQKLHDAIEEFDPYDYPPLEGDAWTHLDWHSVVNGTPERHDP